MIHINNKSVIQKQFNQLINSVLKLFQFTWRESISFSSSYARAPSLLPSSSSSMPGRRIEDPHCRVLRSGSMLITEKATAPSCPSTPTLVVPGNRGPATSSWTVTRNGGTRSRTDRRERPPRQHSAQVRILPWWPRGTSPLCYPVCFSFLFLTLFVGKWAKSL